MTQKYIYSNFYLSIATQQLSELTGNQAIQFPVVTKARDGRTRCNVLIPFKSIKELHGLSFLTDGVYRDFPLE